MMYRVFPDGRLQDLRFGLSRNGKRVPRIHGDHAMQDAYALNPGEKLEYTFYVKHYYGSFYRGQGWVLDTPLLGTYDGYIAFAGFAGKKIRVVIE